MAQNKILLVEDDEILAKVLSEELSEGGFTVKQAFDGEVASAMIKSEKPNLVLLDLILPKKNGFDVLAEAKKSADTAGIPVIILSMLGSDEDLKKGLSLGANDYIVKSQHAVGEILEKVKSFMDKQNTNPTIKL